MPFYAVHVGRQVGVYNNWSECKEQVINFKGAKYKKFETQQEAEEFSLFGPDLDYDVGAMERKTTVMTTPSAPPVVVYTDGASSRNGTKHARAGYGVYFGDNDPKNVSAQLKGSLQTNQRAEATAILVALKKTQNMNREVEIRTDSQYCIQAATKWIKSWEKNNWKSSTGEDVKNKDLFTEIRGLMLNRKGPVKFTHVRGHSGEPGNEKADRLAVEGAQKPRYKPY